MGDEVAHGCLDRHERGVIAERVQPAARRLGDILILSCGRIALGLSTSACVAPRTPPAALPRVSARRLSAPLAATDPRRQAW